jgi:SAM-dependent methyltransferase
MWNERYSQPGFAYGTEPNDFLRDQASLIPKGRVLALADGEGRNGVYVATLGHHVTSVDLSSVGLAKAKVLAADRGVSIETVVADLGDFVIAPSSWEGVVSIFCHLPPDLRRRVYAAVVQGLVPGGVLVLESYTPRQLILGTGGPSSAELMPTLEQLQEELIGLEFLHGAELEREVREGAFHKGRAAVVQVVARRPA